MKQNRSKIILLKILPLLLFLVSCAERKQERINNLIQNGEYTELENYEDGTVPDAAVHPERYNWKKVKDNEKYYKDRKVNFVRILIPKNNFEDPVLFLNRTDYEFSVFARNSKIYSFGKIKNTDPYSFSGFLWHIADMPNLENEYIYIIYKSNYHLYYEMTYGSKFEIIQFLYDISAPGIIVINVGFLLGIIFFIVAVIRKLDSFYLSLSLFYIFINIWMLLINHAAQFFLVMNSVKYQIELVSLFLAAPFNLIFVSHIVSERARKVIRIYSLLFFLFTPSSLVLHYFHIVPIDSFLLPFNMLTLFTIVPYFIYIVYLAFSGNSEAKILTAGIVSLIIFAIHDAFIVMNVIHIQDHLRIFWGVLGFILSLSGIAVYRVVKMHLELQEKNETQRKLIKSYARFVPEQLLYFLGKDIVTDINLGDSVEKEMAILFSDIRSFTTISESMTPDENFGFINSYMAVMGPCIRKNSGFIDKYIGDAIMALFPEKPSDAIDAAIDMLDELHTLNLKRKEKGFMPISIGIGIHIGTQMLGIIGEKERLEGTVISDAVNTASRLEGLTKSYSSSLLVSMDLMEKVSDRSKYHYRKVDTVKVKGKNKAVQILEILNGNSKRIIDLKLKTKALFEEGISLYFKRDFESAKKKFETVLKEDPKDKAAEIYFQRCSHYSRNGIDPDWDGAEKLDFK